MLCSTLQLAKVTYKIYKDFTLANSTTLPTLLPTQTHPFFPLMCCCNSSPIPSLSLKLDQSNFDFSCNEGHLKSFFLNKFYKLLNEWNDNICCKIVYSGNLIFNQLTNIVILGFFWSLSSNPLKPAAGFLRLE